MSVRRASITTAVVAAVVALAGCTTTHSVAGASLAATSPAATPPVSIGPLAVSSPSTASAAAKPTITPAVVTASAPSSSRPCGRVDVAPHYAHVVWIWMENKPYGSVIGQPSAPYENGLAKQCGQAMNYHGITHPSLPNYLAATGGSTFGVTDDASPSAHQIGADSIFGQLTGAAGSWRSYQESMPSNCDLSPSGGYAVKHNPAAYFTAIRAACATFDVALEGNLERDIAAGALSSFSFVTPNLCNDTHDCSVRTGDEWLATWIPRIVGGSNYRAGNTLIVLTWDEGVGSGNLIPTMVVAPSVPAGTGSGVRFDHYSLLKTTEELLGLPALGAAAAAPSMRAAFHV
jgi:phosphatidylinositol-3-phosphatase